MRLEGASQTSESHLNQQFFPSQLLVVAYVVLVHCVLPTVPEDSW